MDIQDPKQCGYKLPVGQISVYLGFTKRSKVCQHEGVVDGGGGDEDVLLDGFVLVPNQSVDKEKRMRNL